MLIVALPDNGVGSGLTSITAVPRASARSGKPAAGSTIAEVPTTTITSALPVASTALRHGSSGSGSPNHTMSGRIRPPQSQTGGSTSIAGSGISGRASV
ncbi:Uncharacterised protein [Mycobacterium tuberculosis]|uniref:Uncharacterized protein n=1 Tax=Mycobacterium tuberculosis TaxID=1773 RepID=A0A0U0RWJ8_MYCTX|nr:Uncharacterised protein [Mycobacterium tuberculosis]